MCATVSFRPVHLLVRASRASLGLVGLLACLALVGCAAGEQGEPCVPESVPVEGFTASSSWVESSSTQCRSRVCLAYRLQGHPGRILGEPSCEAALESSCITQTELDRRVFCSCRCRASDGPSDMPLCACNEGFHCVDLANVGPASNRGGYCIPEGFCEETADCAPSERCVLHTCVAPG